MSLASIWGYCFQIKDDIFDYFKEANIGKPTGNDIREGKVTLPLLYALRQGREEEAARYLDMILRKDFAAENVDFLDRVRQGEWWNRICRGPHEGIS